MTLPDSHAKYRGSVQSLIDFTCYRCGLPPLGLAADEPYKDSWNSGSTVWSYPVEQMTLATKQRRWSEDDFNRLELVLAELRPGAGKLWKDEAASNLEGIKKWAFSFVRDDFVQAKSVIGKNPPWSRDELILALNLYMQHRASLPTKGSVKVAELSRLLRKMGNRLTSGATFRNVNGVYMKLMNFRSIDPSYTSQNKVGLQGLGKDDQKVWNLYSEDLQALKMAADAITAAVLAPISETGIDQPDEHDIQDCEEGRILTRLHRYRERNRKLVQDFKDLSRSRNGGKLICSGCDLDYEAKYGAMAEGLIDVHHTKPIHTMKPGDKTSQDDLVLVCVSCHRAIHSEKMWLDVFELRRRIAKGPAL